MLGFTIDLETCIGCGQCASECPASIISMENGTPEIAGDLEKFCIGCLHCLAVCSESSVQILGFDPHSQKELTNHRPDPAQLEMMIKGRRSVRNYQAENLPTELIDKLVEVASHAPSGHNSRQLRFTLVDKLEVMEELRLDTYAGLDGLAETKRLPEDMEMFHDILGAWKSGGKDILFRGAPHLLVVSASEESASPLHDCLIALTTFELYAQSHGVGTIWNGLATLTFTDLLPEMKQRLAIPEDHQIGYVMGFGYPAIRYKRVVDRGIPDIHRVG